MKSKLVLFDLDGTLYVSGRLIPGARELIDKLSLFGLKYGFMTNNSSVSPDDYLHKLNSIGLPASLDNIITSCEASVLMLRELDLGSNIFVVGTERFKKYLGENSYYHDDVSPSAVLVGFDLELTFEKITKATRFLSSGLPLLASHPDVVCPSSDGPIPDAGMLLAAIKAGTGVAPQAIAGKPNRWILEVAKDRFNVNNDEIIIVGDRLTTDILMANNFKMRSVLVLSGVSKRGGIENSVSKPDVVVDSVQNLIDQNWFGNMGWI